MEFDTIALHTALSSCCCAKNSGADLEARFHEIGPGVFLLADGESAHSIGYVIMISYRELSGQVVIVIVTSLHTAYQTRLAECDVRPISSDSIFE